MDICRDTFNNLIHCYLCNDVLGVVEEAGLKELLQEASKYYDANNMQIAVEKLWDAFERLKTYYCSPSIDKKKSVNKIVKDMGNSQQAFMELFDREFHALPFYRDRSSH